jgi:hypothetical protein
MMASLRSSTVRSGSGILASVMQFSGSAIPGGDVLSRLSVQI